MALSTSKVLPGLTTAPSVVRTSTIIPLIGAPIRPGFLEALVRSGAILFPIVVSWYYKVNQPGASKKLASYLCTYQHRNHTRSAVDFPENLAATILEQTADGHEFDDHGFALAASHHHFLINLQRAHKLQGRHDGQITEGDTIVRILTEYLWTQNLGMTILPRTITVTTHRGVESCGKQI